jgi:N-acetyl-anhydromuramyl-L-alanine amidase AmpD
MEVRMYKILLLVTALQAVPITKLPLPAKTLRDTTRNFIVIHNDGSNMSAKQTHSVLRRRRLAYHYFIDRNGKIYQYVDPKYVAKHAGISLKEGMISWNDFSIGICLQGKNTLRYTDKQYQSLQVLVNQLKSRYKNIGHQLYTHSDIAFPWGRKKDPGELFDMTRIQIDTL